VTRNRQSTRFTIERLASDCLEVRDFRRRGISGDERVEIGPSLRWPKIARITILRHRIELNFWHQATTQFVRVSWTKVLLAGSAPSCSPHCHTRVASLHRGLGGYSATDASDAAAIPGLSNAPVAYRLGAVPAARCGVAIEASEDRAADIPAGKERWARCRPWPTVPQVSHKISQNPGC
jgi:hypothetical protein